MIDTTKIQQGLKVVLALLIVGAFVYLIYINHALKAQQQRLENAVVAMKTLPDGTVRSESTMVSSKDMDAFMKQDYPTSRDWFSRNREALNW